MCILFDAAGNPWYCQPPPVDISRDQTGQHNSVEMGSKALCEHFEQELLHVVHVLKLYIPGNYLITVICLLAILWVNNGRMQLSITLSFALKD